MKQPRRGVPTEIRGVIYPSISEAARQLGVNISTVFKALNNGTLETCGLKNQHAGYLDGVWYLSKSAAAREIGISQPALVKRIERGTSTWLPVCAFKSRRSRTLV